MFLRLVIPLLLAFAFFLYLGILNPYQVLFTYAPDRSIELPFVLLFLLASFAGGLALGLFSALNSVGIFLKGIGSSFKERKDRKVERRIGEAKQNLEKGNFRKGLKSAESALSNDPNNLEALLVKGNLLRSSGRHKEALEVHSLALASHPSDLDAILHVKEDYLSAGHLDAAYKMLEKVRGRRPKDAEIMIQMREIAEMKGDLRRSIVLQKEIVKNVQDVSKTEDSKRKLSELYCISAGRLQDGGDIDGARQELVQATQVSQGFLPVVIMLAEMAIKDSNLSEAERILKKEFKNSYSIAALDSLRTLYLDSGQSEKIEDLYRWAIDTMGDNLDAKYLLLFLAMEQIRKADFIGAEGTLNKAGSHFSGTTIYNLARGVVEIGMAGDESTSASSFRKALEAEWGSYLKYSCHNCKDESANYFTICQSCGKWDSAIPRFS